MGMKIEGNFTIVEDVVSRTMKIKGRIFTGPAKNVYSAFCGYRRNELDIYPSHKYLRDRYCHSDSTIKRAIADLIFFGLVTKVVVKGRSNTYLVKWYEDIDEGSKEYSSDYSSYIEQDKKEAKALEEFRSEKVTVKVVKEKDHFDGYTFSEEADFTH